MPDNRVRVTKLGSHLVIVDDGVSVTKTGAYAEIIGSALLVTSEGAVAEYEGTEIRVTSSGAVVEIYTPEPSGPPLVSSYSRGASSTRSHYRLPAAITGYALDPSWSMWSFVVPEQTLNYLENPSFEKSTSLNMTYTGGISGVTTSTTAGSIAGLVSLTGELDGTNAEIKQRYSAFAGGVQTPAAGQYTFSCWVWAISGTQLRLWIEESISGAVRGIESYTVHYTGWHRYWVTAVCGNEALSVVLNFPSGAEENLFYTDAWQLEKKAYPTTYADGDMQGFFNAPDKSPYRWTGKAHQSASIREKWTRSGGRLYNLAEDGQFFTTSIVGLNMLSPELETRQLGSGEEIFVGSKFKARTFTITGRLYGESYEQVISRRDKLVKYLQPDYIGSNEPLILQYALTDSRGREMTTPVEIVCSYTGGLEGSFDNFHSESYAMQFRAFSGIRNKVWDVSDNYNPYGLRVNPNDAWYINAGTYYSGGQIVDGSWTNFSIAQPDGYVVDMAWKEDDNKVAMVGNFDTLVGELSLDGVLEYDLNLNSFDHLSDDLPAGAWNATRPYRCAYGRGSTSDYFIVMGDFTAKGAGTYRRLAYKNLTNAWTEPDDGLSAPVGANDVGKILPLPDGRFVIGGDFLTDAPAAVTYNNIAIFEIATDTISPLNSGGPAGLNGAVHDMIRGRDGHIYICGAFTQTGAGDTMLLVSRYDLQNDTFSELGDGIVTALSTAYWIEQGRDGYIYVAHGLTAGGYATTISRWNGTSWSTYYEVESGGQIQGMAFDLDGVMHLTGDLDNYLGGPDSGSCNWYKKLSLNVERHGEIYSITSGVNPPWRVWIDEKGRMAVAEGFGVLIPNSPLFLTEEVTLTNNGTTEAKPIIHIAYEDMFPMVIEFPDVGAVLNFDVRFQLYADEELILDFSGESPRIYSNQRQDLEKWLVPGTSNLRDVKLLRGDNKMRFLCATENSASGTFRVRWRSEYHSIDPDVEI